MNTSLITDIINSTDRYNFHSHSEFCDGHAPASAIAGAAADAGFEVWGISPHSPICVESGCNMRREDMPAYLDTAKMLAEKFEKKMRILTALEIDYISRDWGPHTDYFRGLPLDYRIGSVHFVPTQEGRPLDCDGSAERFSRYLMLGYRNDLRYVVEKYFEQVLTMLELGGFEMLGHFDKIAGNACSVDPEIESRPWYVSLVEDVIRLARETGVVVEINTKALKNRRRFYPAENWWKKLIDAGVPLAVNSDCHSPELCDSGRGEALSALNKLRHPES